MKTAVPGLFILFLCFTLIYCGKKTDHGHAATGTDTAPIEDTTATLYDQVMKLHDEGMAKMDEIYKLKEELKNKATSSKELVQEQKKKIDAAIEKLDSASRGMMVWMREFHPEVDTLSESLYRQYLEEEMEKVKKVRDDIVDAIERAKEVS